MVNVLILSEKVYYIVLSDCLLLKGFGLLVASKNAQGNVITVVCLLTGDGHY